MATASIYCPHLLYSGSCSDANCRLNHDAKFCGICGAICPPARFQAHLKSKTHLKKVASANRTTPYLSCPLCKISVVGEQVWSQHLSGAPHLRAATRRGIDPNIRPDTDAIPVGHRRCMLCNRAIPEHDWSVHARTKTHVRFEQQVAFKAALERAESDKKGVAVSHSEDGADFGVVELADSKRGVRLSLVVRTTEPSSRTSILEANVTAIPSTALCPFSVTVQGADRRLVYKRDTFVDVIFRHGSRGRYNGRVELLFEDQSHSRFMITRQVRIIVGNPADHELLKAEAPHTERKRVSWKRAGHFFPGRRPPAIDAVPWKKKLAQVPIPELIIAALKTKATSEETAQAFRAQILPKTFDATTHGLHFKVLLWIEEYRMEQDLRIYDIPNATLTKGRSLYNLVVPGLAEKRPSVLVGDRVEVQASAFDSDKCYEGWVHVVELNTVGLAFHNSFKPTAGQHFNVRFKLNRVPLRRQHQALSTTPPSLPRLLFPMPAHAGLNKSPTAADVPLTLCNQHLASNPEQLQAVRTICRMRAGAAPFVVFGPPGTGKTVTIVEAIQQVLRCQPNARILACTPSNSAADIIAQRLTTLGTEQLFRFYAVSRGPSQVPPELMAFTFVNQQGHFALPAMERLLRFRVVVATCGSASFPHGIGMPAGHFSHIFVDEAGQASEAEVMTAIKTMLTPTTNIVLSGDPKQLGPVIRSAVARELGLGKSYLERAMEREIYDLLKNSGMTIVKLVKNFRSHEAILSFPSVSFYESELQTRGDARVIRSFVGSSVLVNPDFPIVFHAVSGQDNRESSSPSYFNIDEIGECTEYVRKLLRDARYPIAAQDIGIIAPYQAQVRKVRQKLKDFAPECKVGSVEEFQGQERRAIIVSTVRSTRELMQYDAKYTLGFVSNPRRFNVAMTRAQALLVVVGDPSVLSIDPLWRAFLNYVHLNGGWRGDPITWDARAPVQEGAYDAELREVGLASAAAFMRRIEEFGGEDATAQDVAEGEANAELVFREVE